MKRFPSFLKKDKDKSANNTSVNSTPPRPIATADAADSNGRSSKTNPNPVRPVGAAGSARQNVESRPKPATPSKAPRSTSLNRKQQQTKTYAAKAPEEHDVVVAGAGLAGLAAAWELQAADPGVRVAVLEARADRPGGRVLSEGGHDLGGQVLDSSQAQLLQLLDQLGVKTARLEGSSAGCCYSVLWGPGGRPARRLSSPGWTDPAGWLAGLELQFVRRRLGELAAKIEPRYPYKNREWVREAC